MNPAINRENGPLIQIAQFSSKKGVDMKTFWGTFAAVFFLMFSSQTVWGAPPPPPPPPEIQVRPGAQMVPAVSPDLVVSIVSIGTPHAENRNPFTGRIEDASGPADSVPIYVTLPLTVKVKNLGRTAARPLRVSVEAEGGMPPGYLAYNYKVAGSILPSMLYLNESLAPGAERTFSGTLISQQFTLALYRSDAEGVTMRYRVVVDPPFPGHPSIRELSETNNYSRWSMPVNLPRATLAVGGTPVRPDLTVTIGDVILKPGTTWMHGRVVHNKYDIFFRIYNRGTANYRGQGSDEPAWEMSFYAESNRTAYGIRDGWSKFAIGGCPDIALGGFRELKVQDADLPVDCTLLKVIADPKNREFELNEGNNTGEKSLLRTLPESRVPMTDVTP